MSTKALAIKDPIHRLGRMLYGERTAGDVWSMHLHTTPLRQGWRKVSSAGGANVYSRSMVVMIVYVDDGGAAGPVMVILEYLWELRSLIDMKAPLLFQHFMGAFAYRAVKGDRVLRILSEARYSALVMDQFEKDLLEKEKLLAQLRDFDPDSDNVGVHDFDFDKEADGVEQICFEDLRNGRISEEELRECFEYYDDGPRTRPSKYREIHIVEARLEIAKSLRALQGAVAKSAPCKLSKNKKEKKKKVSILRASLPCRPPVWRLLGVAWLVLWQGFGSITCLSRHCPPCLPCHGPSVHSEALAPSSGTFWSRPSSEGFAVHEGI